jgi:hypothetical protein
MGRSFICGDEKLQCQNDTQKKTAMIRAMLVIERREIDKDCGGRLPMYVPLRSTISNSGENFWPTSQ